MRKILLLLPICCSLFFSNCKLNLKSSAGDSDEQYLELNEKGVTDNEDGIRAAQEMEFERTKDISLGYVPKYRLIQATENLRQARMSGNYAARMNALAWTERGSNSDAVGPSNGNGRVSGTPVTSGRIRAIWVDLADASGHTVWVGGVDGGIWKTTNISASPATWTPVNDFFGNLAIGSISQDPSNTNVMYFGTGEKAFNADAVLGGGVWKSTDHGVTWNLLSSTTSFYNVSKIVCDASGNVYVATIGSGAGLQRSTDGGSTWTNISPTTSGGGTRFSEMVISSTGRLHVVKGYYNSTATQTGYFYTDNPSTVTSATWTSPTTSFTPTQYNVGLAVAGNTLYALPSSSSYQTNQVWKSTDGGTNWAMTTTTPTISGSAPLSSGQGWYNLAIGVDPSNANNVMVGGLNSYMSTDGGATWSVNSVWVTGVPGSTNYIHADHHTVVWNNGQVMDGSDGGIFYSSDNGVTFSDRNAGLRLKQFYSCAIHPTSTNYFLAGAQDNGCHQFNGAGLTSSVEVTGGDGAFVHIDEDEPQYQFGSYVYNNYRRSTNGGASWSSPISNNNGSFINPTDYDDINNIMYCGANANQFYRWSNAQSGNTLTTVSMTGLAGGDVSCDKVSQYITNRVFFGSDNGKIIIADNANTATPTFTDITSSSMTAGATVSCVATGTSDKYLLATFSNYGIAHVWISTTGGGSSAWTNISGDLPDIPVRWAMFYPDDNTQAILATEMGIYETSLINGSSTHWVQNSSFPVVRTDMLQYRFSDNTVAAATHGRGLWTSTIAPSAPYVRFASSYTYSPVRTESTTGTTGCRNYTDYTLNMHIDKAPSGNANVTLSIAGGGTATQGIDFDFTTNGSFSSPSNVLTFPSGSTTDQPITIRVYNDDNTESTEYFTFNYTIGGGTDAQAAPSSSYYTFYIGDNDAAPTSTAIETVLNNNQTDYISDNSTYYFYSTATSKVINSIASASASLGCVSSNVFEAGTTWQSFLGGTRSQKVIEVIPATNSGSSYTISLYYTAAELGGKAPASLKIAKTTASTMALANSGNTTVVTTSFATYNGSDYVFTASFTGFSKFFLVDNNVVLPVDLVSFSGILNNQLHTELKWQTTNQFNLDKFEVQRSYDGIEFTSAGFVNALQNPASIQQYNFTDPLLAKAVNFYRLKMVDQDGKFKYSAVVKINNSKPAKFVELMQNPVRDNISFIIANQVQENVSASLYNSSGQRMKTWYLGKLDGYVVLPLDGLTMSNGIYIFKIYAGSKTAGFKISKQ